MQAVADPPASRTELEKGGPNPTPENDGSGDASQNGNGPAGDAEQPKPGQQLTFGVGGKKPTASTVLLVGGKIEDGGEYKKGDVVRLEIEAVVSEVAFVDKFDSETGQVVATERRHKLKIHGHEVLED